MNLISAKAISELHLNGVKIEWVKEDKTVKELRLHDGNGGRIVVRAGSYGDTLKVMIPQPYEEDDRYLLSGRFLDVVDIREYFTSEYEANDKLREYERKAGSNESGLSVEKIRVKINDAGAVVDETKNANANATTDGSEIPF